MVELEYFSVGCYLLQNAYNNKEYQLLRTNLEEESVEFLETDISDTIEEFEFED